MTDNSQEGTIQMDITDLSASLRRIALTAATIAVTLTLASCGGDDDGGGDGDDVARLPAVAPTTAAEEPPSKVIFDDPDTRAALASVRRFYKAMRDGDAAVACDQLSAKSRRSNTYEGEDCVATYRDVIASDQREPGYSDRWTAEIFYAATPRWRDQGTGRWQDRRRRSGQHPGPQGEG
jgi:hypothetical protein